MLSLAKNYCRDFIHVVPLNGHSDNFTAEEAEAQIHWERVQGSQSKQQSQDLGSASCCTAHTKPPAMLLSPQACHMEPSNKASN